MTGCYNRFVFSPIQYGHIQYMQCVELEAKSYCDGGKAAAATCPHVPPVVRLDTNKPVCVWSVTHIRVRIRALT